MENPIRSLQTAVDLDRAWELSHERPVLLLKHSVICGTSHAALEQFRLFAEGAPPGIELRLLEIQPHRDLSATVAERSGVRHQSPQVLLLDRGKVVWSTTHWNITREKLTTAFEQARAEQAS